MGSNEVGLPAGNVRNDNAGRGLLDRDEKEWRRREWRSSMGKYLQGKKPYGQQNNNVMSGVEDSPLNAC